MEAQKTALSHWVVVSHWAGDDCTPIDLFFSCQLRGMINTHLAVHLQFV